MQNLKNQTDAPVYLIFLGPPGSGKGTQADLLAEKHGWLHLSTGDLFRENIARGTELGVKVKDILASGALVPDDITVAMVILRLREPDTVRGVVFDGFPRTDAQAAALQGQLTGAGKRIQRAIYFHLADEAVIARLSARRVCPVDGAVYNLTSSPPRRDAVCDNDGAALVQRDDDKPETVRTRLDVYRRQTTPVIEYYRLQNLLTEIDATQDIESVQKEIDSLVQALA